MNVSGVVGLAGFFALIIAACMLGGDLDMFVHIPAIIIAVGVPIAASVTSFGGKNCLEAIKALLVLISTREPTANDRQIIFRLNKFIDHTYAAGIFGAGIGLVQSLANMDDPSKIGPAIALSLISLIYVFLLAEGILRPAMQRLKNTLPERVWAESIDKNEAINHAQYLYIGMAIMITISIFFVLILSFSTT
ncbi:MAG: hypothetical protein HQL69_22120 [Magnetococcales bacterium]|nr:hypothetical protein [Magnetococcales bacterium]